jgi:hypothetical protein
MTRRKGASGPPSSSFSHLGGMFPTSETKEPSETALRSLNGAITHPRSRGGTRLQSQDALG